MTLVGDATSSPPFVPACRELCVRNLSLSLRFLSPALSPVEGDSFCSILFSLQGRANLVVATQR